MKGLLFNDEVSYDLDLLFLKAGFHSCDGFTVAACLGEPSPDIIAVTVGVDCAMQSGIGGIEAGAVVNRDSEGGSGERVNADFTRNVISRESTGELQE